jgi:hypothetical protein
MEIVDGHGYDWHGVPGAFLVDAVISGGICVALWIVLFRVIRVQDRRDDSPTPSVADVG